MKPFFFILFTFFLPVEIFAHVGSAGVVYQGQAGPYRVTVNLIPPDVIPGTASVTVYVENGQVSSILARPIYFRSGDEGAPSPDALQVVVGQASQFQGVVWLMDSGSSSVQLQLEGPNGKGELLVPVVAISTAERKLPVGLGWILSALGLLLVILMVTAIGASVSDGLLKTGIELTAAQKRKRWINMGIASVICLAMLYGGSSWWNSWADDYRNFLYKPLQAHSKVVSKDNQRILQFQIDTTSSIKANRRRNMLSFLIPDHGKLMHLFLVRTPNLDAFAHLHPERKDSTDFQAYLPKLPAGKYLVYADIVQRSGFAETIVDTVEIPDAAADLAVVKKTDEEDTYVVTDPLNNPKNVPSDENVVICGKPGTKTKLKDGSLVVWEGKPNAAFEAGKITQLSFEVFGPDGKPAVLESYLGMPAHAAIVREDGSVYIHLHPVGTAAMAANQTFQNRVADSARIFQYPNAKIFRDSIDRYLANLKTLTAPQRETFLMQQMGMSMVSNSASHGNMKHGSRLTFPYAFPKAGRYRIFVQLKRNGQILTGVFDAKVVGEI